MTKEIENVPYPKESPSFEGRLTSEKGCCKDCLQDCKTCIVSKSGSVNECFEDCAICLSSEMSTAARVTCHSGGSGTVDDGVARECYAEGVVPSSVPNPPPPPDGGWGWMVAFGSFIVMMLIPMLFPCFGILFSGYLLENGASSVTTAWIFNIQGFIWNTMGVFVRPLVEEFGWRRVGVVGITLVSTSLIVSAFTPSPVFLFFSLSLLSGAGGGLVTGMCFLIVPIYFEKRRGRANSIMMMGICSGEILGPLLVRFLLEEYSFLGANLIIGAILLNGYAGILVFHPVEWHSPKRNLGQVSHINSNKILSENGKANTMIDFHGKEFGKDEFDTVVIYDPAGAAMRDRRKSIESLPMHPGLQNSSWTLVSSELGEERGNTWPGGLCDQIWEKKHDMMKSPELKDKKRSKSATLAIHTLLQRAIGDLGVLKSPKAAIIATGNMLCMNSYLNFVMMVPFSMQALGHSLQEAAWVLSVSAISNMLTRQFVSPMSDWQRFNMKSCYMGGYALLALTMFVFPILNDLRWLVVVMGFFGCALGANMALYNLVMIEYMGLENLGPVFGASGLLVGVGFLFFGTISGFVRDVTGSYTTSMWILSAMSATSFLLWLFMPTAIVYDEKWKTKEAGNRHHGTPMDNSYGSTTSCAKPSGTKEGA